MNICLVTVHASAAFIPLALLYLNACLEARFGDAVHVTVLEFPPEATEDDVVRAVVAANPVVIGMSCYVWNIRVLMASARHVKAIMPGVRVVLGGPEVGPVAESVMDAQPYLDVIVNSEGEGPFCDLIERWAAEKPVCDVRGICYRDGAAIVQAEPAQILMDLDEIPSPHLGGLVTGGKDRIVCIETQRGCVFRCNFCFYNKDLSIRNRRFGLERVKAEILYWLQRDVMEIFLMDPVFNLNAERTKEICRFIARHNHRGTAFHAEVWAEFIDEESARLFRDANVTFLEVGLQTTDEAALATVERRLRLNRFLDGIRHLKTSGIPFELQLIYGLPGETRTSFRRSLQFAASLEPPDLVVFPLMVLPGTELWRKARGLHLTFDPDPPYYLQSHMTMDREDIAYGREVAAAVELVYGPRSLRVLAREARMTIGDMVDHWIEWHRSRPKGSDGDARQGMLAFIDHVCHARGVPSDFYKTFAAREFVVPEHPDGLPAAAHG